MNVLREALQQVERPDTLLQVWKLHVDSEVLNLAINFDEYVYCILRWGFKRQICLTSPPTTYPLHSGSALLIWLHDFSTTCWKKSAHFYLRKFHSNVFSRIQVEGWAGTRDKIYREKISTLVRAVGEINNIKWWPSVIQSLWFRKLITILRLNIVNIYIVVQWICIGSILS